MPGYAVTLARTYLVTVEAKNKEDVCQAADTFVCEYDGSTTKEQNQYSFSIEEIEPGYNDAIEAQLLPHEVDK